jgi:hypothetical protein
LTNILVPVDYMAETTLNKEPHMANGESQNKNENFFQKYQNWVLAGLVVLAIIVFFIIRGQVSHNNDQNNDNRGMEEQNQGQNSGDGQNSPTPTPNPTADQTPNPVPANSTAGNVSAVGTLKASDNASRGNLMVESSKGKIYVSTKRDYSAWIGKTVTLDAAGTLDSFKFLGFLEAKVAGASTSDNGADMGGAPEADTNVKFSGKLQTSPNASRGNYTIVSGNTVVYFKTVRDYSAWVGSDVTLSAQGSLNSFTHAVLMKK